MNRGLVLGVLATSHKENERRLPIHPEHFGRIDAELRGRTVLEGGYGTQFGVSDATLAEQGARLLPREEVVAAADVVLLPKPTLDDVLSLRDGQTHPLAGGGAVVRRADTFVVLDPNGHKLEIHASDLGARLEHCRVHATPDMHFSSDAEIKPSPGKNP